MHKCAMPPKKDTMHDGQVQAMRYILQKAVEHYNDTVMKDMDGNVTAKIVLPNTVKNIAYYDTSADGGQTGVLYEIHVKLLAYY